MSHYAKVENGIVKEVIVADEQHVSGLPGRWIQTSYNTRDNQHPQARPSRGNFASPGFIYLSQEDVFIPPKIYQGWQLNRETWRWEPPYPPPQEPGPWGWDDLTLSWKKLV